MTNTIFPSKKDKTKYLVLHLQHLRLQVLHEPVEVVELELVDALAPEEVDQEGGVDLEKVCFNIRPFL